MINIGATQARTWESASRKTRVKGAECDGVGIIALIHKPEGTEIVLQRQYRAPINGVCIEIPAGLLDPRESLEECALRELIEETGYYGSVVSSSPPIFNDPGTFDIRDFYVLLLTTNMIGRVL